MSQNDALGSVDVTLLPQYKYRAIRSEFKKGKAKAYIVEMPQKLVIVKSKKTKNKAQYVLTLIPDKDYYEKNKNRNIIKRFLNSGDKDEFSGYALYTLNGFPARLSKYKKGEKIAGASIIAVTDNATIAKRLKTILRELSKMKFQSKEQSPQTRFGEDGYGWEDAFWDSFGGGWGDFGSGGNITFDGDGDVYIDYDGDGNTDEKWVYVGNDDTPTDPDPWPDNNDEDEWPDNDEGNDNNDFNDEETGSGGGSSGGGSSNQDFHNPPSAGGVNNTGSKNSQEIQIKQLNDIVSSLAKIISDKNIAEYIRNTKVTFTQNNTATDDMKINLSTGKITHNSDIFNTYNSDAIEFMVFHETLHKYYYDNGIDFTHDTFLDRDEYRNGVKDIFFDGEEIYFVDYLKFWGCNDTDEYNNKLRIEKELIKDICDWMIDINK